MQLILYGGGIKKRSKKKEGLKCGVQFVSDVGTGETKVCVCLCVGIGVCVGVCVCQYRCVCRYR